MALYGTVNVLWLKEAVMGRVCFRSASMVQTFAFFCELHCCRSNPPLQQLHPHSGRVVFLPCCQASDEPFDKYCQQSPPD